MTLAAPVSNPEQPDQELLRRGYVLQDTVLARLAAMGIDSLFVEFPGLDDLDKHLAVQLSPERQRIYSQIKQTIGAVQRQTQPKVTYTDYYAGTRDLVLTLLSQGQHPIYLDQMSRMGDDAVSHATAVAHLSLMIGLKLENYLIEERKRLSTQHAKEVVNLGVAGMLHDIGKLKLPEPLRPHHAVRVPEDEGQREEWETHVQLSYDMVRGGVEASAASAILNHHQHFDGTGFPKRERRDGTVDVAEGKGIHVFPRIIMAADLYDRLSNASGAADKRRRSNLEVLHLMRTAFGGWCDPRVLGAVQSLCPPYPPGQRVGLSDGTSAVVVDVNARRPFQPLVRRFVEGDELRLEERTLDLALPGTPSVETVAGVAVAPFLPADQAAAAA